MQAMAIGVLYECVFGSCFVVSLDLQLYFFKVFVDCFFVSFFHCHWLYSHINCNFVRAAYKKIQSRPHGFCNCGSFFCGIFLQLLTNAYVLRPCPFRPL